MFPSLRVLLSASLGLCLWFAAGAASATNYTLWIHGRNSGGGTVAGTYNDFRYWGPATASAGVNKKAVNWDGVSSIATTNGAILNALDCYCTGSNFCYIAVHSAGDMQIGYALSLYGGSARYKKNATPNSAGVCGNSDGKTQTGWNIKWVAVASGASGGSELADLGSWATSEPLNKDLMTATARAKYNHSQTYGRTFYRFAGASGTLYSALLPGQDDEAVSYHTTGGVAGSSGASFGNPSDFFSNDLTLGTAACEGGAAKWSYHTVYLRDDGEVYNHYAAGNWAGIIGPVRSFIAAYAL
ncbi:MAG TPA: hypothetical protein PLW65_14320 [Pseudomonadota bacterium]|nr:hypothetical protein [Pseudomonadota bacterium]